MTPPRTDTPPEEMLAYATRAKLLMRKQWSHDCQHPAYVPTCTTCNAWLSFLVSGAVPSEADAKRWVGTGKELLG